MIWLELHAKFLISSYLLLMLSRYFDVAELRQEMSKQAKELGDARIHHANKPQALERVTNQRDLQEVEEDVPVRSLPVGTEYLQEVEENRQV